MRHDDDSEAAWKVPASQLEHNDAPTPEYAPAAQLEHAVAFGVAPYSPALHGTQVAEDEAPKVVDMVPTEQPTQSNAPVLA